MAGERIGAGDNTGGTGIGDGDDSAETLAAGQAQVAEGRPTHLSPTTTADVRREETALQLSPDEVRLIRSYRRLHPHARRATLHYIGSLLIEE